MTPRLLGLITAPLAASEAVEIEALRVLGVLISSGASIYAAFLANRNRQEIRRAREETREVKQEVRRRRRVMRASDTGDGIVVVDEPADC